MFANYRPSGSPGDQLNKNYIDVVKDSEIMFDSNCKIDSVKIDSTVDSDYINPVDKNSTIESNYITLADNDSAVDGDYINPVDNDSAVDIDYINPVDNDSAVDSDYINPVEKSEADIDYENILDTIADKKIADPRHLRNIGDNDISLISGKKEAAATWHPTSDDGDERCSYLNAENANDHENKDNCRSETTMEGFRETTPVDKSLVEAIQPSKTERGQDAIHKRLTEEKVAECDAIGEPPKNKLHQVELESNKTEEERFIVQVLKRPPQADVLYSDYYLEIAEDRLRLLDINTESQCLYWPYTAIRRFGMSKNKSLFCFEAGRRCESGEGEFFFKTDFHEQIYKQSLKNSENIFKKHCSNQS